MLPENFSGDHNKTFPPVRRLGDDVAEVDSVLISSWLACARTSKSAQNVLGWGGERVTVWYLYFVPTFIIENQTNCR